MNLETTRKELKLLVIFLIGIPGTLLALPFILFLDVILIASLFSGNLFEHESHSKLIDEMRVFLLGIGGPIGLLGFWFWAGKNPETTTRKHLIFMSASNCIGAISASPLIFALFDSLKTPISPNIISVGGLMIFYGSIGAVTGITISLLAVARLTTRSRRDGVPPRP